MSKYPLKASFISPFLFFMLLLFLAGCGGLSTPQPTASGEATTSQWNPDPAQNIRVTTLGGDQAIPRIVTSDNGDFYVAWFSNPNGENYDVRMQRYDADGNGQWGKNGRIISDNKSSTWISDYIFTKDNDGNLILIFQDIRSGDSNLYAYKFSPDGDPLWGEDGLQLTDLEGFVGPAPATVSTPDHISLLWEQDSDDGSKLVVQKLAPDGEKLWGDDGLIVPGQESASFIRGSIASGGGDDLILVYGIEKQAGLQIMSIYAQKLDKDGNSVWNGGEPILLHDSVPFFIRPQVISDGADGAYFGWYTTELKGFVQHLDADGQLLMPEDGAPLVASGTNLQIAPRLLFSPEKNELFAFWMDTDKDQRERGMSGQKMSPTGELLWGENGRNYIELARAETGLITPQLTGGNIVVFYTRGETAENDYNLDTRLYALLLNDDGEMIWQKPAVLASELSPKADLEVGVITDQEWIAVWHDGGVNGSNVGGTILMQNLPLADGATGNELANPASVFCEEQGGALDIRTDEGGGEYGICVFDDGSECEEWAFYRGECKPE